MTPHDHMVFVLVTYATVAAVVMAVASYGFGRTGATDARWGEWNEYSLYAMMIGTLWPVFVAMAPIWALCFLPGMLGAWMRGAVIRDD